MRVVAVPRLPKFGPGNGTVFGACGKCANTKGPQKRVRSPDMLLPRFSHKLALSSELFNLEIRNKTAENKSLGKVMTPMQNCSKQQLLMSKLATTTGNKNCVAVHLLHQRLERVLRHCGGPLSMAMFSSSFQPPKTGP